jgi:hypothetical protein
MKKSLLSLVCLLSLYATVQSMQQEAIAYAIKDVVQWCPTKKGKEKEIIQSMIHLVSEISSIETQPQIPLKVYDYCRGQRSSEGTTIGYSDYLPNLWNGCVESLKKADPEFLQITLDNLIKELNRLEDAESH